MGIDIFDRLFMYPNDLKDSAEVKKTGLPAVSLASRWSENQP
jgi:hypothetical protein